MDGATCTHADLLALAGTPEETPFLREVLDFLDRHADRRDREIVWGEGPEHLELFHESSGDAERAEAEAALAWQATKWEAGFGWLTGPTEYGGRGLPASYERLCKQVEAEFDVADWHPIRVGLSTVGPSLVINGAPEQIREYAVGIQAGRMIACQLFSEPDAGSDLANVRTRAVRDGDVWRLTGQKVWTSNGTFADIGLAIARTDPDVKKHAGLTAFLVPMDADGIEVRPIRQITGGASFTEVFLEDVVVPDGLRVGEVGGGWGVAVRTLAAERGSTGNRSHEMTARALQLLQELARRSDRVDDPHVRHHLVDLDIRLRVARSHQQRMQTIPPEELRGPEGALDKLFLTDNLQRIGAAATEILGTRLIADQGDWGTFAWNRWILGATGYRLGGGTDEILRTLVGERLLDLPRG